MLISVASTFRVLRFVTASARPCGVWVLKSTISTWSMGFKVHHKGGHMFCVLHRTFARNTHVSSVSAVTSGNQRVFIKLGVSDDHIGMPS